MSLDALIQHAKRERDLFMQALGEAQRHQADAVLQHQAAHRQLQQVEAKFQFPQSQVTSASDLRQRYSVLDRRREEVAATTAQLAAAQAKVAEALAELVASRQQLKAYQRLVERRGAA